MGNSPMHNETEDHHVGQNKDFEKPILQYSIIPSFPIGRKNPKS
jgi:hypothetical protein